MKNSGSENQCTILSALTEKIVPYNLHVSIVKHGGRVWGGGTPQVNINILQLFLL